MANEIDAMQGKPKRVLISYSQESDEHRARVRTLADQLCSEGIDAIIDQYEPHPPEGWPMWMERQIKEADVVLLVFSEVYWRRAEGREEPGIGLGVAWEADLIRSALYEHAHHNSRFIPVLFRAKDEQFIMDKLKTVTRYVINEKELDARNPSTGYSALYRRITEQPLVAKPPLGKPITLAPINVPIAVGLGRQSSDGTPPKAKAKGTVLLAETTVDVTDFATFLRESGYEVIIPQGFFAGRDLRDEYQAALAKAMLVVQILGLFPFPPNSLFSPDGYQRWQLEQARAANKSVLRWRSPAIDLTNIADEQYRQFIDDDVVKCDPEDFKTVLLNRLTELATEDRSASRNLFVHFHTKDTECADDVGGNAEEMGQGIKVALTDQRRPVQESIGTDPVHGLIVVYGNCGEQWVEESIEALKLATDAANIKHNLKPPPRAIVFAKPGIPPLRHRPPRWKEIVADDTPAIANFVKLVQGEGVSP